MLKKLLSVKFRNRAKVPKKLKIIESLQLSPHHRIVAIEASNYVYLLGLHPQGFLALAEYDVRIWSEERLGNPEFLRNLACEDSLIERSIKQRNNRLH